MSKFLRHKPCPKCGSKDNLGEYSDHYFCFGCKYYKLKDDLNSLRNKVKQDRKVKDNTMQLIKTVKDIPRNAMKWLLSYGISKEEIDKYNIQWSPMNDLLVLIQNSNYWQGRSFRSFGPKYMSNGMKPLTIYGNGDKLVLVEDVLSAMKIARLKHEGYCASPLLGSTLSSVAEKEYLNKFSTIYVWLDRDKAINAIRIKNRLRSKGIISKAIVSPKDPKEYTKEELADWLKNK